MLKSMIRGALIAVTISIWATIFIEVLGVSSRIIVGTLAGLLGGAIEGVIRDRGY